MVKEFYKILEINENATQKEIKAAYRRLVLQWHPDKNLHNKEEAEERFKKISEAYEILGIEELRKKYDNGSENNFANYDWDSEEEKIKTKLEKLREERREIIEMIKKLKRDIEKLRDIREEVKELQKRLIRFDTISSINWELYEFYDEEWKLVDSNLWFPYKNWEEKVERIEIKSSPRGESAIDTSELDKFEEQMIEAIKKAKAEYKKFKEDEEERKNQEKEQKKLSKIEEEKEYALEQVEKAMKSKAIKSEELEEKYRNYQEQINDLDKIWKIQSLREDIIDSIKNSKKKNNSEENIGINNSSEESTGQFSFRDNDKELNNGNLPKENESDKKNSEQTIQQLQQEIEKLKKEIAENKNEGDSSSEFQIYLAKKENELKVKQQKLKELINSSKNQSRGSNPDKSFFASKLFYISGGILVVIILVLVVIKNLRKRSIW